MDCLCPQKPGMDVADGYVTFVRHSQDMLREKVNEEVYTERLFDVSSFAPPQASLPLPEVGLQITSNQTLNLDTKIRSLIFDLLNGAAVA